MEIRLAPDIAFDLDALDASGDGFRAVVCGESGSGKSHVAASILGQALLGQTRSLVLDAHGEYGNLALLSSGDNDVELIGYPDSSAGGDAGAPPQVDLIPDYVRALERSSLFFNLLHWVDVDPRAMNAFVFPLLRAVLQMQHRVRRRLLLLVEETQQFAPRIRYEGEAEKARLLSGIATGGRKFGFLNVYCTQRPALLDATVLSSCNVRVFLRTQEREDFDAVKRYIPPRLCITYDAPQTGLRYFESGEAVVLSRWGDARTMLSLPPVSPTRPGEIWSGEEPEEASAVSVSAVGKRFKSL